MSIMFLTLDPTKRPRAAEALFDPRPLNQPLQSQSPGFYRFFPFTSVLQKKQNFCAGPIPRRWLTECYFYVHDNDPAAFSTPQSYAADDTSTLRI